MRESLAPPSVEDTKPDTMVERCRLGKKESIRRSNLFVVTFVTNDPHSVDPRVDFAEKNCLRNDGLLA